MKIVPLFLMATLLLLYACNNDKATTTNKDSIVSANADTLVTGNKLKIQAADMTRFFAWNNSADSASFLFSGPVKKDTVLECLTNFTNFMNRFGVNSAAKGLTTSVSFDGPKLQQWLVDNDVFNNADELRICFGFYDGRILNRVGFDPKSKFRITVFLWPYKNGMPAHLGFKKQQGDEIDPFNLGNLKP